MYHMPCRASPVYTQNAGVIMDTLDHHPEVGKSWTNHGSITKYQGRWYLFYHTTALSRGHDKRRSFAVENLHFDDDGGIWVWGNSCFDFPNQPTPQRTAGSAHTERCAPNQAQQLSVQPQQGAGQRALQ